MSRDDFPPAAIQDQVRNKRGIVLIRGFPNDRYDLNDLNDLELVYWGLGTHFGTGVSQSVLGDRIGHVTDMSRDEPSERSYRNANELTPHTDCNEMIAMLSVHTANRRREQIRQRANRPQRDPRNPSGVSAGPLRWFLLSSPRRRTARGRPVHRPQGSGVLLCRRLRQCPLRARLSRSGCTRTRDRVPAALTTAMAYFNEVASRDDIMLTVLLEPGELSLQKQFHRAAWAHPFRRSRR